MESLARLKGVPYPSVRSTVDLLALAASWTVLGFRLASWAHRRRMPMVARAVRGAVLLLFGADLAPAARVGAGLTLPHPTGVVLAPGLRLGRRAHLMGNVRLGLGGYDEPTSRAACVVGEDCWFFDGAMVAAGAVVGDRVVLGTNAVVHDRAPDDVVLLGDPARVVRHRVELPAPVEP